MKFKFFLKIVMVAVAWNNLYPIGDEADETTQFNQLVDKWVENGTWDQHKAEQFRDLTPLHIAAMLDKQDRIRSLVADGVDVNIVNPAGNSALIIALFNGKEESVRTLLEVKADPNMPGSEKDGSLTPLHLAVVSGNLAMVQALLAAGANDKAVNAHGCTPLRAAEDCGKQEIVRALINHRSEIALAERKKNLGTQGDDLGKLLKDWESFMVSTSSEMMGQKLPMIGSNDGSTSDSNK